MEVSDSEDDSDHSSVCPDVLIRRARVSDVDEIARIYSNSLDYLDVESREWIEGVIKKHSRRARVYVAIKGEKVVGFALAYKNGDRAYIDALAVDSEYRGRGIGQCLLTHVESALALDGVERIYLTVKNHNHRALGVYIKNGYRISNVVLILKALSEAVNCSVEAQGDLVVRIDRVGRGRFPKVKLLDVTIWNNFTWDVDDSIYRVSNDEAIAIAVYKGGKLLGLARAYQQQNIITVERLAVSFYRPTYSLKAVVGAVKAALAPQPGKAIVIPVDSTKTTLLKTLISMGFKVVDSEYVLCKDLSELRQDSEVPQYQLRSGKYKIGMHK